MFILGHNLNRNLIIFCLLFFLFILIFLFVFIFHLILIPFLQNLHVLRVLVALLIFFHFFLPFGAQFDRLIDVWLLIFFAQCFPFGRDQFANLTHTLPFILLHELGTHFIAIQQIRR